ncbi:MAG TPA: class I SAM-dependent methyltransferase [Verrucomicrobiae bacterium]|jgi:SAM-dependent methyltransferase
MNEHTYVGGELELFAHAHHWKRYWISKLRPFIRGAVLEAGAGIGTNTAILRDGTESRWVCLEPDPRLAAELKQKISNSPACRSSEILTGTIDSLPERDSFDTILYIDVLEHIPDDRREIQRAACRLRPNGRLIVLSPAHGWLYSPFDKAIGHCRRYTARALRHLTPHNLRVEKSFYLDSVGLLASATNRVLLRQSMPKPGQLRVWDNFMVPCSRWLDPLTAHRVGKSVVCVWERSGP